MGVEAARQFYRENRDWLNSVDEAFEFLYGRERPYVEPKLRGGRWCPVCGKRLKSPAGVRDHLKDYHKSEKAAEALRSRGPKP